MKQFIEALENHNLDQIRKCEKSDLHNHFVLGGNRDYIRRKTNIRIDSITAPLQSMDQWNQQFIGSIFDSRKMREFLIEATFWQAKMDGIRILEIGEDVWALREFFDNKIQDLINAFYRKNVS